MSLYLYNTLSKRKEIFKPIKKKLVTLYSCGPTVYDFDHLGHAWNYFNVDILRRVLEYNKYKVKHVMNITDVGHLVSDADIGEDKVEKAARKAKKTPAEIAAYYTKIFLTNCRKLNFLPPRILCPATKHIPQMLKLLQKLWKKNYAYQISDGVYFDILKFPTYGKLSGNTLEKLKAGARIAVNPEKRHPADFALWRFVEPSHIMRWSSPWGTGCPGWHLECSAMAIHYLGETIDIHTGGEDNIFPHHEGEIAQSEAATGKKFVNYWLHSRHLIIEGEKMSKSLGNFLRLQDLEEKNFSPLTLRYLFLTSHHRTPLNFTWEALKASQNALNKLCEIVATLGPTKKPSSEYIQRFLKAINDDLNMPKAIAIVWDLLKSPLPSGVKKATILQFDCVLGLDLKKIKKPVLKIPAEVKKLVAEREQARRQKDWQKSDALRQKIFEAGFIVQDTPQGPKLQSRK